MENRRIVESNKIKDLLEYVTKDTLVVFDIDNTLVENEQEYGGYAWSLEVTKRWKEKGLKPRDALIRSYKTFAQVQDYASYKPVEQDTAFVLKSLQEKQIKTMVLTMRSFNFAPITFKHLLSVNMDFSKDPVWDQGIIFGGMAGFTKGILYAGPEVQKGELLVSFFEKIKYKPKHVLFIDDAAYHVESVSKCLVNENIPNVCIRYGATDERSQKFDPAVADKKLLSVIGKEKYKEIFEEIL